MESMAKCTTRHHRTSQASLLWRQAASCSEGHREKGQYRFVGRYRPPHYQSPSMMGRDRPGIVHVQRRAQGKDAGCCRVAAGRLVQATARLQAECPLAANCMTSAVNRSQCVVEKPTGQKQGIVQYAFSHPRSREQSTTKGASGQCSHTAPLACLLYQATSGSIC